MTYNFSEELKRNISMEHHRRDAVSHAGVADTLVEFERQYADIHASLESLNRAETHTLSLESIIVSLEAIKESTRSEKSVALAMANISLEAVEHSFELPTRTVAVSLEDGEPEEQTTTMVNKIKGALAAIKDSAVQVLGQIGQNLQALLGSVIAGATKFKSKLAGLKSQAGNAQGGQELSLGGSSKMLTIGGGNVDGGTYVKDLSETMKIFASALATFKDADDMAAFADGLIASNNGSTVDLKAFAKKSQIINALTGKTGLGGGVFAQQGPTEQDINEFIEFCTGYAKQQDDKGNVSVESLLSVSMEDSELDVPEEKRALWKKLIGVYFYVGTGFGFFINTIIGVIGLTAAVSSGKVAVLLAGSVLGGLGYGFSLLAYCIGHRCYKGEWPSFGKNKASTESYTISMESADVDVKLLTAVSQDMYLNDGEAVEVSGVTSLDSKQAGQVIDMLSSLADSTITYAKSLKDRKAVTATFAKGLKELTKQTTDKKAKVLVDGINATIEHKFKNIVAFETSVNKYALNVLRAGVAYVEASVNTKAVETPAEEA